MPDTGSLPCPGLQMDDIEALNYDDLSSVARLIMEKRYHDIMEVSQETFPERFRSQHAPPALCTLHAPGNRM